MCTKQYKRVTEIFRKKLIYTEQRIELIVPGSSAAYGLGNTESNEPRNKSETSRGVVLGSSRLNFLLEVCCFTRVMIHTHSDGTVGAVGTRRPGRTERIGGSVQLENIM
jgi:hypothetical protein